MPASMSDDEIRILYVIGGAAIGGMETHLITLASSLPPSVRCFVCCLEASADYEARLREAGIAHAQPRLADSRPPPRHSGVRAVRAHGATLSTAHRALVRLCRRCRLWRVARPWRERRDRHQPAWRRRQPAAPGGETPRQPRRGPDCLCLRRDGSVRAVDRITDAGKARGHPERRGLVSCSRPRPHRTKR